MDLEKMESLWAQHNTKLEQNLKLQEELLRELKLTQAKRELSRPLFSEILSSILTAMFVIYLGAVSFALLDEFRFSLPGFIAAGSAAFLIYFAVLRISKIKRLDERSASVLELQKRFYALQHYRSQVGRWEIVLGAILLLAIWPIILWTGFGVDLYESSWLLGITVGACALIGIPVGIWYGRFYRRKMGNTEILLSEIKDLEKG